MFSGVIPALLTPFTADDRIDVAALDRLIQFVIEGGVNGLYVTGSSGEGISLSEEERQLVVEQSIKSVRGRIPIIVHVGAPATPTCERLAKHAERVGAAAVASVPPFYYSVGTEGVETHYRRIARATKLPLYIYNIPGATGVNVGADMVSKLFDEGTIQGLKFTATDLFAFRTIIEACHGKLNVLSGPDEMFLPFLVMGGHGSIGTTLNVLPRLYVRLFTAWQKGDIKTAQELQYFIDRFVVVLFRYGVLAATKATLGFLGIDVGEPRGPFIPLTAEQKVRLRADLEDIDFFTMAKG